MATKDNKGSKAPKTEKNKQKENEGNSATGNSSRNQDPTASANNKTDQGFTTFSKTDTGSVSGTAANSTSGNMAGSSQDSGGANPELVTRADSKKGRGYDGESRQMGQENTPEVHAGENPYAQAYGTAGQGQQQEQQQYPGRSWNEGYEQQSGQYGEGTIPGRNVPGTGNGWNSWGEQNRRSGPGSYQGEFNSQRLNFNNSRNQEQIPQNQSQDLNWGRQGSYMGRQYEEEQQPSAATGYMGMQGQRGSYHQQGQVYSTQYQNQENPNMQENEPPFRNEHYSGNQSFRQNNREEEAHRYGAGSYAAELDRDYNRGGSFSRAPEGYNNYGSGSNQSWQGHDQPGQFNSAGNRRHGYYSGLQQPYGQASDAELAYRQEGSRSRSFGDNQEQERRAEGGAYGRNARTETERRDYQGGDRSNMGHRDQSFQREERGLQNSGRGYREDQEYGYSQYGNADREDRYYNYGGITNMGGDYDRDRYRSIQYRTNYNRDSNFGGEYSGRSNQTENRDSSYGEAARFQDGDQGEHHTPAYGDFTRGEGMQQRGANRNDQYASKQSSHWGGDYPHEQERGRDSHFGGSGYQREWQQEREGSLYPDYRHRETRTQTGNENYDQGNWGRESYVRPYDRHDYEQDRNFIEKATESIEKAAERVRSWLGGGGQ